MELSLNLFPHGIKRMIRKLTQAGHTNAHGVALPVFPTSLGKKRQTIAVQESSCGVWVLQGASHGYCTPGARIQDMRLCKSYLRLHLLVLA